MPRRKKTEDNRTIYEKQCEFLTAYADSFNIDRAAAQSRIDPSTHFRWFRRNPKYAEAFKRRKDQAAHYLEAECIRRAGEGWLEDVYYQGAPCGQVRRFDSGLAQFLLRGMMPEKYGSRTEISGPQGQPLQAKIEVVFVKPGEDSGGLT